MEIREGYKKTDVGIIPKDWTVLNLASLATQIGDIDHKMPDSVSTGVPYIMTGDFVGNNDMDFKNSKRISIEDYNKLSLKIKPQKGDIIFARYASVGATRFVTTDQKFLVSYSCAIIKPKNIYNGAFIYYYFSSNAAKQEIDGLINNGTQKNIGIETLKNFKVILPPAIEQQAIVSTLSDVDGLIASLTKLIDKKKNIKQGAMQQLLTGKKRLDGFSGDWVEVKLGDIGEINGAGVDKKSNEYEIPVRLVNYLDVYRHDYIYSKMLHHCVTAPQKQLNRCEVKKGDIFFTPTSEVSNDIGASAVAMEDIPNAVYSYHVVRLRVNEDWNLTFRTHIFKTRHFLEQAETYCEGCGTRYVISQKRFREFTVKTPPTLAEQTAIATVLSDMGNEIEALEQKLNKYKDIKQGMMQQLLTGRVRLM